jgi:shikimate dehydrogenase
MGAAAAYALLHAGAEVVLCNRTPDRARELAEKLSRAFPHRRTEACTPASAFGEAFDIVVQATSAGMGESPENPLDGFGLSPATLVVEAVAHPVETPAVRLARRSGATVIDGVSLFAWQAAEQFRLWSAEIFGLRDVPMAAELAGDIERTIRGGNTPGAGGEEESQSA